MKEHFIHIAVIDDGINENRYNNIKKLSNNIEITSDLKVRKRTGYDTHLSSHGTICAAIIKKYAENAVLSSIKILNSETEKCLKSQLITAIYWCVKKNIKVINLSLGTTYWNDFKGIIQVIDFAYSKGVVIIASCSNKNIYTCPASLDNVIGVKSDEKNWLQEGEFVYNNFHPDGVEITACSRHNLENYLGEQEYTQNSNSYATPMITAYVYHQILSVGLEITTDKIKNILAENSLKSKYKDRDTGSIYLCKTISVPIIMIYGEMQHTVFRIVAIIGELFKRDGFNSVAVMDLVSNNIKYNVFPMSNYLEDKDFLTIKTIKIISKIHDPDIIIIGFVLNDKVIDKEIKPDIRIIIEPKITKIKKTYNKNEHLIIISHKNKYGRSPNRLKIFRKNEIKKLYKYIMQLFKE